MKIYSFTFARSGSKGLKNKNLRLFNNKPLVCWAIKDAKNCKLINKVFISTNSKKIAKVAEKAGAIIPFLRPKNISGDQSPEWNAWKHAINFLKKNDDLPDLFVSVPCTSPLRTSGDLKRMINFFIKNKADAVVGIYRSGRSPFFNIVKKDKNYRVRMLMKSKKKYARRQDCPPVYNLTTFAFILKTTFLMKSNNLYSGKVLGYEMDNKRSVDIDTLEDLNYAEYLNKKFDYKKNIDSNT